MFFDLAAVEVMGTWFVLPSASSAWAHVAPVSLGI